MSLTIDRSGVYVSCFLFSILADSMGGWFRFGRCGPGFAVHDRKRSPAPFSVRAGGVKEWRVGRLGFQRLARVEPEVPWAVDGSGWPDPLFGNVDIQVLSVAARNSAQTMDRMLEFAEVHGVEFAEDVCPDCSRCVFADLCSRAAVERAR